ncbi:hypothetical protein RUM44_009961 [Polyplax serrata]|uniref:Uncharacterized protein n=1 Tax=Polyplax serrata TaxID=468196 RepID=A0ABR1AUE3_POLSC
MPHYVEKGRSVILYCNYSLPLRELYKIEWQKNDKKIYQYVKVRKQPMRNFTIPGGTFDFYDSIDWSTQIKHTREIKSLQATSNLIMETLTNTQVKFNGEISKGFVITSGERRRDGLTDVFFRAVPPRRIALERKQHPPEEHPIPGGRASLQKR